jgi:glucose/arabinose dehydrogenase/mono/diheme cytochrome c family protein
MKIKLQVISLLVLAIIFFTCVSHNNNQKPVFNAHPSPAYLSPEESLKTMYLPKGYHMELVASEPMIKDPVAITWDGNGRMFVAEMLTYMKDADATGERLPWSRIMLLEDTDNNGKMDKSSVFVDSLLLPRMIQSVGNSLLVNETNSITITSYTDTDGDGKADVKKILYKNDKYVPSDQNMEHQRSGLDWNLDNWMYMTYEPVRFRYTKDTMQVDSIPSGVNGQWGLTHDNYGRLFFSSAGGETPALGFQINPAYGRLDLPNQLTTGFDAVWPIIATPDVQGGNARLRPNNTLNHFTGCSGQSIYRGDGFPKDFVGDYIVCEPVGRIVRRAKVFDIKGETFMKNAYDSAEFISSSDMNFRPVNSATGPDGDLYIVDMYHGIIQQGNWTKPGSFLRKKIDSLGLAKNIGRGRIYRVVYDGIKRDRKPNMLNESSATLVGYLGHPNGWWRDNAQKLIIIRGDKSVVSTLKKIAMGEDGVTGDDTSHLARIHSLWTLEGLNSIDKEVFLHALKDPNPHVRRTAVEISESLYLKKNDIHMIEEVAKLKDDPSYDVRLQVLLSLYDSDAKEAKEVVTQIMEENAKNEMIVATKVALDNNKTVKELSGRLGDMAESDKNAILRGAITFRSLCANCHGADGKGLAIGSAMAAPPLVGASPLQFSQKNTAIRILLGGLTGQVEGKTYPAEMPSMAANSDGWIANVLSYARYEFGNRGDGKKNTSPVVKRLEIRKIREEIKGRNKAWTLDELKK